jgi:CspA family cold shock protein
MNRLLFHRYHPSAARVYLSTLTVAKPCFLVVLWMNQTLHVCSQREAGRAGLSEVKGTVKSYDWIRGDWLVELDEGTEEVFINRKDWRCTALSVGKRLRFQMVHRPKGIYAVPVRGHDRGGLGSE